MVYTSNNNNRNRSQYSAAGLTVLLSEAGSLQKGDLPVSIQVLLVPTQDYDDVLTRQHPRVTQPCGQSVVRLSTATKNNNKKDGR